MEDNARVEEYGTLEVDLSIDRSVDRSVDHSVDIEPLYARIIDRPSWLLILGGVLVFGIIGLLIFW